MLFWIDINVKFFKLMEELSGEIEVHKREKRNNERENKKTKKKDLKEWIAYYR